jgi:tetratricopeptide (TPR) repeat protein
MIFSEIVGREIEMDRLLNHLSKLMEGKGFIVSIIGEAGIGKSRLIAELLKKEEITDMRCLEGRALSIGRNLPFHPVIDLLRKFAGISEDDSEIISFNKCEKLVRDIVPGGADEILPFIATLMGLSLTGKYADRLQGIEGEALEKLILKNLRDFFAKAVESKPMIIIIEDLHWADLSSISLLESLYRLATNNKLLFINVLRPGYDETSGRILTTIKNRYPGHHDEINIEPLNLQQTDLLLNNLMKLKKLPPGIDEKIKEKSGGNPFFVEEVVQSMLDEKVIELEHGSLRLSGKAEDIVIPETISELLLTRIDKLDEDSRRLLKNASVIGRNFFYKVLVELSDNSDNSDTDEILENLKRVQLVLERKRMAEVEYLFKHALIQQAVYGTLLAGQKKELHLRVAKAIEKVFPGRLPDFFGTLAFHYTLAEELNKAENYLIKAGEKALRSGASTEAINYYKDALAIYRQKYGRSTDPEKIAMLEKNIATAMFNKGHFIDAAEYFENALAYYGMNVPKKMFPKALKVLRGIMNIVIKLTFTSLMATKTPSREEREIIELIRNRGASLGLTDAKRFVIEIISFFPWYSNFDVRKTDILVFVALMFSFGGISQKFGSRVLNYYGRKYNKNDRAASFMYLTDQFCTSLWTGDWDQMHYDEAVCNQGLLLGNLYNLVTYVGFQGHLLIERGEREAMKYLDRCSEISEMYDYDYGRLAKYTHGTLYLLKFRLLDEALVRSDESISFIQKTIGNRPGLLMTLSLKVRIQLLSGNIADASETMKTTEELASADIYVPYFLTFYTTTRFMVYLYKLQESVITEDKDQIRLIKKDTLNSGKKAVKVCRQAAFERVETYRLMGTYHWITGNRKTALRWWGKSIDEALRLNAKLELSRTYLEAGKRLLEERSQKKIPEASEAGEYLTKARQLFAEMNLQWDNEKLEQISSKNNALKSEMNKDG